MKITAHIRMLDSGRFEAKCKTLPGCPVIEARTFPQALQDLQEAIHDEFIEQFYAGTDPGQIEIEAAALTAALTFTLDREINHSIFDFGTPRAEEKDPEPRALPESTLTEGWAPAREGPAYHYYVGDMPLCGCADARGGPHECEAPAGIPPFDNPACRECQVALQIPSPEMETSEDPDEGEGWAPEAPYPAPSHNGYRWHYYRDGVPVCGHANPRSGDLQSWPPVAGACPACIEVLHKEELPPIPGHEEDHPETPEEKAARLRHQIIGWGRRTAGGGKLHAIDADGTCLCGQVQGTLSVETDHPENPDEACRFCRGLTGMDEDEEAVEE